MKSKKLGTALAMLTAMAMVAGPTTLAMASPSASPTASASASLNATSHSIGAAPIAKAGNPRARPNKPGGRPLKPIAGMMAAAPALVTTVPQIAAQSTAWGRRIQSLAEFDGNVYMGYGDWGANTGTLNAIAMGPDGLTTEATIDSESTWLLRTVGNRLVVPFVDPKANSADLAWRNADDTWTFSTLDNNAGAAALHVFDVTTLNGTDLWVAGAALDNGAAIWHSPSGQGGDWKRVYSDYTGRVYSITTLGNEVVAYMLGGVQGIFTTTDGVTWTYRHSGSSQARYGPVVADGSVWWPSTDPMSAASTSVGIARWDGTTYTQDTTITGVNQFALDPQGRLWALRAVHGDVLVRIDGVWRTAGSAPANARSIDVTATTVWLGGDEAQVWSAPLA